MAFTSTTHKKASTCGTPTHVFPALHYESERSWPNIPQEWKKWWLEMTIIWGLPGLNKTYEATFHPDCIVRNDMRSNLCKNSLPISFAYPNSGPGGRSQAKEPRPPSPQTPPSAPLREHRGISIQLRHIISPGYPRSAPGPPSNWICLKHLLREVSREASKSDAQTTSDGSSKCGGAATLLCPPWMT